MRFNVILHFPAQPTGAWDADGYNVSDSARDKVRTLQCLPTGLGAERAGVAQRHALGPESASPFRFPVPLQSDPADAGGFVVAFADDSR